MIGWSWIVDLALYAVVFLLFPTGRLLTPRWRWVLWVVVAACAVAIPGQALNPENAENPLTVDSPVLETAFIAGMMLLLVAIGGSIASLVVRYRRAVGIERLQLRQLVFAAAAFVPIMVVAVPFYYDSVLVQAAVGLGLLALPVAAGLAILRYRLYDIDVVINRALVYGSLSATLAGVYVGSVLLLQLALSGLTEGSGLAVAASTLAVAALFRPARGRIQKIVDRRFFRSRYDATQTVDAFGARLRDEVDLQRAERRPPGRGRRDDAARPRVAVAARPKGSVRVITGRRLTIAAWSVAAVTTALALTGIALETFGPGPAATSADPEAGAGGVGLVAIQSVMATAFACLGAVVVARQPRNAVGWLMVVIGFFFAVISIGNELYLQVVLNTGESSGVIPYVMWGGNWAWLFCHGSGRHLPAAALPHRPPAVAAVAGGGLVGCRRSGAGVHRLGVQGRTARRSGGGGESAGRRLAGDRDQRDPGVGSPAACVAGLDPLTHPQVSGAPRESSVSRSSGSPQRRCCFPSPPPG